MTAKTVWGIIIIVVSVCLLLHSGHTLLQIFIAESQLGSISNSNSFDLWRFYENSLGIDIEGEILKLKILHIAIVIVSIIGAIFGTKLLK